MTIKGHKETIEVPTNQSGAVEVDATVYGALAVHRRIDPYGARKGQNWVITHVETGRAVRNDFDKKREAVKFLQMIVNLDWSGNDVQELVKRNRDAIYAAWDEYCGRDGKPFPVQRPYYKPA